MVVDVEGRQTVSATRDCKLLEYWNKVPLVV
jgi:hypothetical protein